ncbi:MAG: hypothetical protein CSA62_02840 [Planctomycetota bacterium]|nr:MAG: hypothetical protein CSA62_02840 [Planctomycetota bacterium]
MDSPTINQPLKTVELPAQPATSVDHWVEGCADPRAEGAIPWATMRNRPLTLREKQMLRRFYDGAYPVKSEYTSRHPWHQEIARWRIQVAQAVLGDLGKTLDAGCAAGELVRIGRESGLNFWGFDLCPDLHEVCYPSIVDKVRIGSLGHVPFSKADGFKTVVSYDVIEHSPIDELELFPSELKRLGVEQVACIISTDTLSEGHITIQDTGYYKELFGTAGYRLLEEFTESLSHVPGPIGWNSETEQVIWAPYKLSGLPPNGWNEAPGYLFFRRET